MAAIPPVIETMCHIINGGDHDPSVVVAAQLYNTICAGMTPLLAPQSPCPALHLCVPGSCKRG
jgi:hypothetical protein